jgi:hypothetical protein
MVREFLEEHDASPSALKENAWHSAATGPLRDDERRMKNRIGENFNRVEASLPKLEAARRISGPIRPRRRRLPPGGAG